MTIVGQTNYAYGQIKEFQSFSQGILEIGCDGWNMILKVSTTNITIFNSLDF